MSTPAPIAGPEPGAATRLFGVETEYGFAVLGRDGERLDPAVCVDALMREVRALVPHLPHRGAHDVFTANGSRVYIDAGLHPEVASPECSTPEEAVRFTRAGDLLLARAANALARDWPARGVEAILWKANVDHHTGATWGSHESYLHVAPQSLLADQLMTHLVTRVIYTGAGGFNNRARHLQFVVAPRAFHLEHAISGDSTQARGIFHTRDESLAAGPYQRLHVLAGESLWSQTSDYLRIGTTALLVAQIDAGRLPEADLELVSPLEALATIARDVRCRATVHLRTAERLTAIGIQRRLLESVEADLGASHLPAWAASVCARWRLVLDGLESSPASLVGVLDWPTKLAVLRRQCADQGVDWTFCDRSPSAALTKAADREPVLEFTARLLEMDMRFNRLDGQGIFASLDREGALSEHLVSANAIARAIAEPPCTGRARIRAACIQRFAGKSRHVSCAWQEIIDHGRRQQLVLGNPFQSDGEQWVPLPLPDERAPELPDSRLRPIEEAFRRGRPAVAVWRMHALITATEPASLAVCRHCVSALGRRIPEVPVPVLGRGMATAGPVLKALLECAAMHEDLRLEHRAGTLLYRYYEARGAYGRARRVITRLLARPRSEGNVAAIASLTNNHAYEHLLAGEFAAAEPLFERALELFERAGARSELASVAANRLECRFGRLPPEDWMALTPELLRLNRALVARHDWRARKSLMLLARLAEHRGRRAAARAWARRALAASQDIPSRLREWDRAYLDTL